MMNALKQARAAFSLLNPNEIRQKSLRPVTFGLVSSTRAGFEAMEDFLVPAALPPESRAEAEKQVFRAGEPNAPGNVDLVLYEQGSPAPDGTYVFDPDDADSTISGILHGNDDLHLALARQFPVFRRQVVERIVQAVSRENAIFAVTTALPDIIPNLMELPWALGEWASDTAFLTANQVRMAFLIAAACGKEIGMANQKAEILAIGAGAFGWRAIARELVGKIPLGGGIIPKGAIAYAGTYAVGKGLERLHHANLRLTADEERGVYRSAFERGKNMVEALARAD